MRDFLILRASPEPSPHRKEEANGATKKAESCMGNRDLGWQRESGSITAPGDKEEGLVSFEVETNKGAISLKNVESSCEVPRSTHQGTISKMPSIEGKSG